MKKMSFFDFLKKIDFLVGDKYELEDLRFKKVPLYHIKEFKHMNNEEFVESMYKVLLKRVADEGGKLSKIEELENGKKREQIVIDMRMSEEGQNYIGSYEFLGIENFSFIDNAFLSKDFYNEKEFEVLIKYLNYKFADYNFSNYVIDLLFFSGVEFTFLLYKKLLKRNPDIGGFNSHLKASYLLKDKLLKIIGFLHSEEARNKNVVLYDLNGNNIKDISDIKDLNYKNISSVEILKKFEKFKRDLGDISFNNLFSFHILSDVVTVAFLHKEPVKAFNLICSEIFDNNKTILEVVYNREFLEGLKKDLIILDYFHKPLKKDFYLLEDFIKNLNFYIARINVFNNDFIQKFNNEGMKDLFSEEMAKLTKFIKKLALKEELQILFEIDKSLGEKLNTISDLLKEHEEILITMKDHK